MNAAGLFCFHCGEPARDTRFAATVADAPRLFCCAGCMAVAQAIEAAGLADYYRLRTRPAGRAERAVLPPELFDRDECRVAFTERGDESQARLALGGVSCPACLWLIGERLRQLDGPLAAQVDYATQTVLLTWPRGAEQLGTAVAAIEALGYRARPCAGREMARVEAAAARRDGERLIFALVAGMAVMNGALAIYLAGDGPPPLPLWEVVVRWLSAALCVPLLAWSGADFFVGAWRDLRNRRLGMDVPIALGLAAALAGSLPGLLDGGPVYFDSIAMLVAAVLGARWFELRARRTAAATLDRLSVIEPLLARRLAADGTEQRIAAFDLAPGDTVRVAAGETVPADGELLDAAAHLNEAHLTGEPLPRRRAAGDTVAAGSVNAGATLLMRVTRTGSASTLGELRALLDRGLASQPRLAALADRAAPWLVGVVLITATLTWLAWQWFDPAQALPAAIAVLIVTCPCALALATPLTLALAAGRLAHAGVVPLRMAALDALATAQVAVFDKTGTLTRGTASLATTQVAGGLGATEALRIAAALEADSAHPLAAALRAAAPAALPISHDRETEAGQGVRGVVDGMQWRLGAPEFAVGLDSELHALAARELAAGRMVAALADGASRSALFVFDDPARAGLAGLGAALRESGLRLSVCLSGDTGAAVARESAAAGLDQAIAGCSPTAKLAWLQERQTRGETVMMVGDGLNDAATLAAADVSLSFTDAPCAAQFAADFLITGETLAAIPRARALARHCRRVLRQNLAWAAAYNLLSIPLAAAGWVPPWLAAAGMAASSVLVVGNALRLARSPEAQSITSAPGQQAAPLD